MDLIRNEFQNKKRWWQRLPKELKWIAVLLFAAPFAIGLYHEYTVYIAGIIVLILLGLIIAKRKKIIFSKNIGSLLITFTLLCYFIVIPFAIDKGMAFAGALRFSVPLLFLFLLLQFDKKQIRKLWEVIPASAISMLILSIVLWIIPETYSFVSGENERLAGFFQYANTFALFMLIGIIVLMYRKKPGFTECAGMIFLAGGIFLTGSRTVFGLLVLTYLWFVIHFKNYRKPLLIAGGCVVVIAAAAILITGNVTNIGRFLTIGTLQSTLYGRLLYWKDAINVLKDRWYGLGYLGYYYIQPSIQTGEYVVRFLHNDWLQVALDAGVIAGLAFIAGNIFSFKKADDLQKTILIVMAVGIFFDFHFIYVSMLFIYALCLHGDEKKIKIKQKRIYEVFIVILMGLFIWLGLSFGFDHFGDHETAVKIYPGNTEARILLLKETTDQTGADIATEIITRNQYIALAYNAKAAVAEYEGNYKSMMMYKDKALENNPYDITLYEEYIRMLSDAAIAVSQAGDAETFKAIAEKAVSLPEVLKQVEAKTDPLSYKINDVPELTLPDNYLQYIEVLKQALAQM